MDMNSQEIEIRKRTRILLTSLGEIRVGLYASRNRLFGTKGLNEFEYPRGETAILTGSLWDSQIAECVPV